MKLVILAAAIVAILWWLARRSLPFDDERIGLPHVEPPADEAVAA